MIPISHVYVPTKRKGDFNDDEVEAMAESILEKGLEMPIQVRLDHAKKRYVLVNGLKRLEAAKLLGEDKIRAQFVEARQY